MARAMRVVSIGCRTFVRGYICARARARVMPLAGEQFVDETDPQFAMEISEAETRQVLLGLICCCCCSAPLRRNRSSTSRRSALPIARGHTYIYSVVFEYDVSSSCFASDATGDLYTGMATLLHERRRRPRRRRRRCNARTAPE